MSFIDEKPVLGQSECNVCANLQKIIDILQHSKIIVNEDIRAIVPLMHAKMLMNIMCDVHDPVLRKMCFRRCFFENRKHFFEVPQYYFPDPNPREIYFGAIKTIDEISGTWNPY